MSLLVAPRSMNNFVIKLQTYFFVFFLFNLQVDTFHFSSSHPCSIINSQENIKNGNIETKKSDLSLPQSNKLVIDLYTNKVFLSSVTVLGGGWVHLQQIEEWLIWHQEIGIDQAIIYVDNSFPILISFLQSMKEKHNLNILILEIELIPDLWNSKKSQIANEINKIFHQAIIDFKDKSEWLAFIDIDEFISPGTEPLMIDDEKDEKDQFIKNKNEKEENVKNIKNMSLSLINFKYFLQNMISSEIDSIYLRWVFHIISDGYTFNTFPVTLNFRKRLSDLFINNFPLRNSGKMILKPKFFTGENSIHHFTPIDPYHYNTKKRLLLPSYNLSNIIIPNQCKTNYLLKIQNQKKLKNIYNKNIKSSLSKSSLSQRTCVDCCLRGKDVFFLSHYRRPGLPFLNGKEDIVMSTHKLVSNHINQPTCLLISKLCERIECYENNNMHNISNKDSLLNSDSQLPHYTENIQNNNNNNMKKKKMPDFILVGVQKSGTSSIAMNLRTHPSINAPTVKELLFFNNHDDTQDPNFTNQPCQITRKNIEEEYLPQFPSTSTSTLIGEFAASYFNCPCTPKIIMNYINYINYHQKNQNIKFIVLFRDPIERSKSRFYEQMKSINKIENKIINFGDYKNKKTLVYLLKNRLKIPHSMDWIEFVNRTLPILNACFVQSLSSSFSSASLNASIVNIQKNFTTVHKKFQNKENGFANEPSIEELDDEEDEIMRAAYCSYHDNILGWSVYSPMLKLWLRLLGQNSASSSFSTASSSSSVSSSSLLILYTENLENNPLFTYRAIEEFLNIKPHYYPNLLSKYNSHLCPGWSKTCSHISTHKNLNHSLIDSTKNNKNHSKLSKKTIITDNIQEEEDRKIRQQMKLYDIETHLKLKIFFLPFVEELKLLAKQNKFEEPPRSWLSVT